MASAIPDQSATQSGLRRARGRRCARTPPIILVLALTIGLPPLSHKAAIVKAGVAALFVYHELKTALVDARSSPLLSKLVSPLIALQNKLNALHQSLRGGHLDSTSINAANRSVSRIGSQSAQKGVSIHDLATSSLHG